MDLGVAVVDSVWTERMRVSCSSNRCSNGLNSCSVIGIFSNVGYNRFESTRPESAEELNARLLGRYLGL